MSPAPPLDLALTPLQRFSDRRQSADGSDPVVCRIRGHLRPPRHDCDRRALPRRGDPVRGRALPRKANQPTFRAEVESLFAETSPDRLDIVTEHDTGHGRIEQRTVSVANLARDAPDPPQAERSPLKRKPKPRRTPKPTSLKLRRKIAGWNELRLPHRRPPSQTA